MSNVMIFLDPNEAVRLHLDQYNRLPVDQRLPAVQQFKSNTPYPISESCSKTPLLTSTLAGFADLRRGINAGVVLVVRNLSNINYWEGFALRLVVQDVYSLVSFVDLYGFPVGSQPREAQVGATIIIKDPQMWFMEETQAFKNRQLSILPYVPLISVGKPNFQFLNSDQALCSYHLNFPWHTIQWQPVRSLERIVSNAGAILNKSMPYCPLLEHKLITKVIQQLPGGSDQGDFRDRGKALFGQGNYHGAAFVYLKGLKEAPRDPQLLNNLSLCYAQQQRWALARHYAQRAFRADPANVKAAYSLARALFQEGKLQSLLPVAGRLLKSSKLPDTHKDRVKKWRMEASRKTDQAKYGKYPLREMLQAACTDQVPAVYPDYVGPVRIANIPGKGRGLVTTQFCAAGTLLYAERALVTEVVDLPWGWTGHSNADGGESSSVKNVQWPAATMLVPVVLAHAKLDEEFRAKVIELDPGEGWSAAASTQAQVRVGSTDEGDNVSAQSQKAAGERRRGRTADVSNSKDFDGSGCVDADDGSEGNDEQEAFDCNQLRLKHAVIHNTVFLADTVDCKYTAQLYFLHTFVNHSCVANAVPMFLHNMVLMRAVTDIPAGNEIVYHYMPRVLPNVAKQALSQKWGFECTCAVCTLPEGYFMQDKTRYQIAKKIARGSGLHSIAQALEKYRMTPDLPDNGLTNFILSQPASFQSLAPYTEQHVGMAGYYQAVCRVLDTCQRPECILQVHHELCICRVNEELIHRARQLSNKYFGDPNLVLDVPVRMLLFDHYCGPAYGYLVQS